MTLDYLHVDGFTDWMDFQISSLILTTFWSRERTTKWGGDWGNKPIHRSTHLLHLLLPTLCLSIHPYLILVQSAEEVSQMLNVHLCFFFTTRLTKWFMPSRTAFDLTPQSIRSYSIMVKVKVKANMTNLLLNLTTQFLCLNLTMTAKNHAVISMIR